MGPKATVGRIVHYHNANGDGPFAAIVLRAEDADGKINASVYNSDGGRWIEKDLPNAPGGKAHWAWPPRE